MPLDIKLSPLLRDMNVCSPGFLDGISFGNKIINSTAFKGFLKSEICENPSEDIIESTIDSLSLNLDFIMDHEYLDAYCLVCRRTEPHFIYFNPLLALQMRHSEFYGNTDLKTKINAFFIGVKIAHEVTHILHFMLSESLRQQLVSKRDGGSGKRKAVSPTKEDSLGHTFYDFGEFMEHKIFGGVLEWTDEDGIIAYPFPNAKGYEVNLISGTLEVLPLVLGAETRRAYSGARGYTNIIRFARFSKPMNDERDVIDEDIERLVDDQSNIPEEPTF
jgi:hypothetical protein